MSTNSNEQQQTTSSNNILPPTTTSMEDPVELPGHFEDVPLDDLVILIADLLDRMIVLNDQIPLSPEGLTRFHSRSSPAISVLEYLRRIVRYVRVERSVLLLLLHSIDQICSRRPSFNISSLSVHRFVIAAVTILSKAFCDAFSPNPHFAKVGGVSLIELNLLEREFLSAMDWRLACTRETLHTYYVKLVRTHSTGRYTVQDTSPRPTPIDTLPSDLIEWNALEVDDAMHEDSSDESSASDEEPEQRTQSLATDAVPRRPISTRYQSRASTSAGHSRQSSATIEQNVAFAELRNLAARGQVGSSALALAGNTRSPMLRSPVVGRRRRRSSGDREEEDTILESEDASTLEGALRGSRRRRLDMESVVELENRRMEVEPSPPG